MSGPVPARYQPWALGPRLPHNWLPPRAGRQLHSPPGPAEPLLPTADASCESSLACALTMAWIAGPKGERFDLKPDDSLMLGRDVLGEPFRLFRDLLVFS